MKILITGGLGFIFSHVSEYLSIKKNEIVIFDKLADGSHPELIDEFKSKNIQIIEDDINNIKNYSLEDVDYIIHAAAESNVDKSIKSSMPFLNSNILGTYQLLEYYKQNKNLKEFLYVNTDEVYGSTTSHVQASAKENPQNPYSASKSSAGKFCWAYKNTWGVPVKEVRFCNVIGPRQAKTKLLPLAIHNIKNDIEMPIYDGGTNTREYMDVRNVCELIHFVMNDNQRKVYNLTANLEYSILDVVKKVGEVLGKEPKLVESTRPGHDKHYRMVADYITSKVSHYYTLEETIKSMI